jgi:hypothetical protein
LCHRTAVAAETLKTAAARQLMLSSIAATTRFRKSIERGCPIHAGLLAPALMVNQLRDRLGIQFRFRTLEIRSQWLSAACHPLQRLAAVVGFELFRREREAALSRSDRLSFMRFGGLALHDGLPDAKTIWTLPFTPTLWWRDDDSMALKGAMRQLVFFDLSDHLKRLSGTGDRLRRWRG